MWMADTGFEVWFFPLGQSCILRLGFCLNGIEMAMERNGTGGVPMRHGRTWKAMNGRKRRKRAACLTFKGYPTTL